VLGHDKNGYITAAMLAAIHKPLLPRPGHLYTLHQPNFFGWATVEIAKKFGPKQVELGASR
jgi:hypothetical protein